MTMRELQYLVAVADCRHFGRAAEHCHVSQPTLSAQLRKLEDRLGVVLVERGRKGAKLTPVGAAVVTHARRVLAEVGEIETVARAARDPLAGAFHLGLIPTLAPYLLPRALKSLRASLPAIEWSFEEDLTASLLARLREGALDAAILAAPVAEPGLAARALFHEPFLLACPAGHPLARAKTVTLAALRRAPLLLLAEGHCLRGQVEELCRPAGRARDFDAVSLETLRQLVAGGLGCTLLPQLAAEAVRDPALTLRDLDLPRAGRDVLLVTRGGYPRTELIERLAQTLRARVGAMLADAE